MPRQETRWFRVALVSFGWLLCPIGLSHGHLHTRPGADPLVDVGRRAPIIPLTEATVRYSVEGERRCDEATVLLVNRERAEWLQLASEEEIARVAYPSQNDGMAAFSAHLPGA